MAGQVDSNFSQSLIGSFHDFLVRSRLLSSALEDHYSHMISFNHCTCVHF